MMQVRCWGGPWHNRLRTAAYDFLQLQRVTADTVRASWTLPPTEPMPPLQQGKYWRTPETDKQGNPIYAWTGWK